MVYSWQEILAKSFYLSYYEILGDMEQKVQRFVLYYKLQTLQDNGVNVSEESSCASKKIGDNTKNETDDMVTLKEICGLIQYPKNIERDFLCETGRRAERSFYIFAGEK